MKDNETLALYIGMQKTDIGWYDNDGLLPQYLYDQNGGNCFDTLYFHESWDWLMVVINKIDAYANETMSFEEFDNYRTSNWQMMDKPSKYPINRVFDQAVEFIKWKKEYDGKNENTENT